MIKNISRLIILAVVFNSLALNGAHAKQPARVIAGWVEKIRVESQEYDVKAKLDSGAKTSSIYATNIESYKKNGKHWIKFTLHLSDSKGEQHTLPLEKPRARKTNIKNHDGNHDKRYVVELDICFNGRKFTTEFSLADRNEYIYGVLLGREFLKHAAIVDSNATFLTTPSCSFDSNH